MKVAKHLSHATVFVAASMCLAAVAIAAYPESGSRCVTTGGAKCNNLGGAQCILQGQTGACVICNGGGALPARACVIVAGGPGCPEAGNPINCGLSGTGNCFGTTCSGFLDGGVCSTVFDCP